MKVAVICEDDRIWNLPVWEGILPRMNEGRHELAGLWTCPERLSNLKSREIPLYYLRTFGAWNFIKMGCFAAAAKAGRVLGMLTGARCSDFKSLCRRYDLHHQACESPNARAFVKWIKREEIDVVIAMVGYILKSKTIRAPKRGLINKHAGLLPANRGLLPYFWARMKNQDQGVSFHEIIKEVDSGALLLQERVAPEQARSLVEFYVTVMRRFGDMLFLSLDAFEEGRETDPFHDYPPSYHGLPSRFDYKEFRKMGGAIIRWRDVPKAWSL